METKCKPFTAQIIGCAIAVHRALGPGLLESVYQATLAIEFEEQRISFDAQVAISATYRNRVLGSYRLDFIVEGCVVVEVKAVSKFEPVFDAQMLTYLRITRLHVGLLINFNTNLLTNGVRRFVSG